MDKNTPKSTNRTGCIERMISLRYLRHLDQLFVAGLNTANPLKFRRGQLDLRSSLKLVYEQEMPEYEREIFERRELAKEFGYTYVGRFNEFGVARATKDDKSYFLIDINGQKISREYAAINPQADGFFEVTSFDYIRQKFLFNFIDSNGDEIIDQPLFGSRGYSEGKFCVKDSLGDDRPWGFYDQDGDKNYVHIFNDAYPYHEGLASVRYQRADKIYKYFSIDHYGNFDKNLQSEDPIIFADGLAVITQVTGKQMVVNKLGEIQRQFENHKYFKNSSEGLIWALNKNKQWVCLNHDGTQAFSGEFPQVEPFCEGLAFAVADREAFYIDHKGRRIPGLTRSFETIPPMDRSVEEGLIKVFEDNRMKWLNKKGREVFSRK